MEDRSVTKSKVHIERKIPWYKVLDVLVHKVQGRMREASVVRPCQATKTSVGCRDMAAAAVTSFPACNKDLFRSSFRRRPVLIGYRFVATCFNWSPQVVLSTTCFVCCICGVVAYQVLKNRRKRPFLYGAALSLP